MNLNTSLGLLL